MSAIGIGRGGGVKNLPKFPTDSAKKLPTWRVKNPKKIVDVVY